MRIAEAQLAHMMREVFPQILAGSVMAGTGKRTLDGFGVLLYELLAGGGSTEEVEFTDEVKALIPHVSADDLAVMERAALVKIKVSREFVQRVRDYSAKHGTPGDSPSIGGFDLPSNIDETLVLMEFIYAKAADVEGEEQHNLSSRISSRAVINVMHDALVEVSRRHSSLVESDGKNLLLVGDGGTRSVPSNKAIDDAVAKFSDDFDKAFPNLYDEGDSK